MKNVDQCVVWYCKALRRTASDMGRRLSRLVIFLLHKETFYYFCWVFLIIFLATSYFIDMIIKILIISLIMLVYGFIAALAAIDEISLVL